MEKFNLADLEMGVAPTGASDAVAGPPCIVLFIVLMTISTDVL